MLPENAARPRRIAEPGKRDADKAPRAYAGIRREEFIGRRFSEPVVETGLP